MSDAIDGSHRARHRPLSREEAEAGTRDVRRGLKELEANIALRSGDGAAARWRRDMDQWMLTMDEHQGSTPPPDPTTY